MTAKEFAALVLKDQVPAHLTRDTPRNTRIIQAVDVGATRRASDAYPPRLFGPHLRVLPSLGFYLVLRL